MLPPDNAQETDGSGQQPTPSAAEPRQPARGDIGTEVSGHADGEPGAGIGGADGIGSADGTDTAEAGTGAVAGGSGAMTDRNGVAGEPSTMTLAAPSASETGAKAAGQRITGGRDRWRALFGTGRAVSRATAAGGAGLAAAFRPARWSRRTPAPGDQPVKIRSADIAGTVLARLTVLPAVLVLAWLIPGVPLLLAGHFLAVPMTLISVALAVAVVIVGLRVVPASWPRLLSGGRKTEPGWSLWFGLLATVAVVAGLTGWQLTESSQAVIVLRDQGAYLQTGYWIAQHGSLPIPQMLSAFGSFHAGLNFTSTGFLARGTSIYPAVLPGLPLLLAGGFWVHGITGALAVGPLLGGLAMLTFAGLVGRLVGPQWAPAGALILGLSLPQQYVSRTSLSETALQIVIFGGLCLMADSLALRGARPVSAVNAADAPETRSARARLMIAWQLATPSRWPSWLTPQRVLAALAGLALSFGLVVSLDALTCLLVVIPVGAALLAGRRPQAAPFLSGLGVGLGYGILCLFLLDRPLLDTVGHTVALAGLVAVCLAAASIAAFQLARIGRVRTAVPRALARRPLRWLPEAGALLVVAALIGFVVRPYVQKVHGHPGPGVYAAIKALQQVEGLQIDPTRTYAEQTLYWVIWYVGLPTVLLGTFALAVVLRRCLRALLTWRDPTGVWRIWGLPLAVICAGSVVALWAPDIVPDQPWASRRLIVIAIPGLIVCGLWAGAWLGRRARDRGAQPVTAAVAGLFCVAAMLVPTVATTFGLGLSHSSKTGGLKPVVHGLALTRTGVGQVAAVRQLCASIPRNVSVVIIDYPTAQEFSQVIRGMCGLPVAWMADQPVSAVESVIGAIAAAGREPLLIAGSEGRLLTFGGSPVRVLDLATTQDPRDLRQLPTSLQPVRYQIWMTEPVPAGSGA